MANKLNEEALNKVTGGYKAFGEDELYFGCVLKEEKLVPTEGEEVYYVIVGNSVSESTYPCLKWVIKDGNIIVERMECSLNLNGSNVIYVIADNPPSFVHY